MMNKLYEKINLSKKVQDRFTELAKYLFFNCYLKAGDKKFYFTELEFYCDDNGKHQDKFIYKKDEQHKSGQICFHQSGMDVTFGNENNMYGGVLIRGLKYKDENIWKYIYGPINIINKGILPALKIWDKFYKETDKELLSKLGNMKLAWEHNQPISKIYRGPRYNLKHWHDKNTLNRAAFGFAPYRYIINVEEYNTYKGKSNFRFEGTIKDKEKFEYAAAMLGDITQNREKFLEMADKRAKSDQTWRKLIQYYKSIIC